MKRGKVCIVVLATLVLAVPVHAEYRTVLIQIKQGKDNQIAVTIHSDEKKEQQKDVSVDEAARVVSEMVGWGSGVGVYIVREKGFGHPSEKKLLAAVVNNLWLDLVYLGNEVPKHVGDHFLR
jgi:hypothetical protein